MDNLFIDAGEKEVDNALRQSWKAFETYRNVSLRNRAQFLRVIAEQMKCNEDILIQLSHEETSLQIKRLKVEFSRTIFQLVSYAEHCETGSWLDIRIDTNNKSRQPPKPDLRKMMIPLGPVVIFGASNFPFAYSTAGGDTACALAAGCTVIIKSHPAHATTSEKVSTIIKMAVAKCGLPDHIFIHLHGASNETGTLLVKHPLTKAVGFTGSLAGGKALFDIANQRPVPIPMFAEMGSVNPVFILPGQLKKNEDYFSELYAASITQSSGQFCTKPGVLIGIENDSLKKFKNQLVEAINHTQPEKMLYPGIFKNFLNNRMRALSSTGVELISHPHASSIDNAAIPALASVSANTFIQQPHLQQEVFGPFSLLVMCKDIDEMLKVARVMEGQLTCSLLATNEEIQENNLLVNVLTGLCGRLILNGVPTGVDVATSMQHGGPYPATTDSRFTAVGADGIKRFTRPFCWQNWTPLLLPQELQNINSLHLWRTVNNQLTQSDIEVLN